MNAKDIYNNLDIAERVDIGLRSLYSKYGYSPFKMSKFEDYDLYTKNKDFIPARDIVTVTGPNGKLLALRPDLTLSIVKYYRPGGKKCEKLYYSENIYRLSKDGDYQEIRQTGLECLGDIDTQTTAEVLLLAAKSLKLASEEFSLDLSHMGFLQEALLFAPKEVREDLIKAIGDKNIGAIREIGESLDIDEEAIENIIVLTSTYGPYKEVLPKLKKLSISAQATLYLQEIEDVCKKLAANKLGTRINIDFSIVNNMTYYSGILFQGYMKGVSTNVLSGGRYDGIMERMGKEGGAIGFALYLDLLDQLGSEDGAYAGKDTEYINVALPKGRLGTKIYELFEAAGYPCPDIKGDNRKLVFENKRKKIRYYWVKPSDVTVYVERGTADIGACGKDVIEEYDPDIYELMDLKKGKCRMCVAAKEDFKDDTSKVLRVATKFPNIARRYYDSESRNIDIIELHGSIELAPVLDMSDVIVDIVETGKTLKENDLKVYEDILDVSARLIANKSSFKFKNARMRELMSKLEKIID